MEQEKKGCSRCNKNTKGLEFTKTEKTYALIAVGIAFFAIYGIVEFVKSIISLF